MIIYEPVIFPVVAVQRVSIKFASFAVCITRRLQPGLIFARVEKPHSTFYSG